MSWCDGVKNYACVDVNNLLPLPVHQGEAELYFLRSSPFQLLPPMFSKTDLWPFAIHNQEERARIHERQGERI